MKIRKSLLKRDIIQRSIDTLNLIITETLSQHDICVSPRIDSEGVVLPFPWTKFGYIGCKWGGESPYNFGLSQIIKRGGLWKLLGRSAWSLKPVARVTTNPMNREGHSNPIYDKEGLNNIRIELQNPDYRELLNKFQRRYEEVSEKNAEIVN